MVPNGVKRPRVVGSVRVSTEEQAREGFGLVDQEAKVLKYCDLHELDLVEVVRDEGVSAKTLRRPGLQRALAMLSAREAEGLVIAKLDRLTRKLRDWSYLIDEYFSERTGIRLHSVQDHVDTSTATGRMMLNIIFTIAQWERETISERTRSGLRIKMGQGERVGRIRFGYDLDLEGPLNKRDRPALLTPNAQEQAAIALMRTWREEGASLRAIAELLRANGIRTKGGGEDWSPEVIRKILNWKVDP